MPSSSPLAASWLALCAGWFGAIPCLAAQPPDPAVFVHNPSEHEQTRTLRVAWPLPRHWGVRGLRAVRVGSEPATCSPRLRWPDQTLALVELRWRMRLAAGERAVLRVECDYERDAEVAASPMPSASPPPVRSVVVDPWGRSYSAELRAGDDLAMPTASAWHRSDDGEAGLFAAHVWWHRVGDNPERELVVMLDNGRCWDAGLGPARLQAWRIACDADVELWPAEPRALQRIREDGGLDLLGPSKWLYLGDATAKVARCFVVPRGLAAAPRAELLATLAAPAYALPDLAWLRWCGVWGLHGGPAPSRGPVDDLTSRVLAQFWAAAEFGPFGGYGDDKAAVAVGSARHGDSALHNVLRFPAVELAAIAKGVVAQGALRPPPGHVARRPEATAAWRVGLSPRTIDRPHGFEAFDYEHVAVDVCFDHYWLTGDPVALGELRTTARAVRGMLGRLPFMTCRGEAMCLRALVAAAWTTADRELLDFARDRALRVVAAKLREHPVAAIAQPPHRDGLGETIWFDAPWQMAMLLCALHALHRLEPDAALVDMIEDLARRLVGPCWLEGVGPKYLVAARDANRYVLPRSYAPLAGTAQFQLAAFALAAELVRDDGLRAQLGKRADSIVAAARGALGELAPQLRADPWFQVWLDRAAPR